MLVKSSHSANISGKTLNCKAPRLCDHRQSMTSYQSCHRAVCCIGQLRPTLPQERDFAMKTPAVSAGCLQYKHSQGSRREVGWQWEQRGAWKDWGTRDTGKGRETSSGKEAETPPSCIEHYKKHGCSPHDCGCVRGSDCISEMICSCKFQTGTCYLFFPFFFAALALPLSITSAHKYNSALTTNWCTNLIVKM